MLTQRLAETDDGISVSSSAQSFAPPSLHVQAFLLAAARLSLESNDARDALNEATRALAARGDEAGRALAVLDQIGRALRDATAAEQLARGLQTAIVAAADRLPSRD